MMIDLPIATFVPTWFMISAMLLSFAWLISEFKGKRWHRIALGLLALLVVTVTVSETRLIIPNYTAVFQQSCIQ